MRNLVITNDILARDDTEVVTTGTIRREIRNAKIFRRLLQYHNVEWHSASRRANSNPLIKLLTARLLSRGKCSFVSPVEGFHEVRWWDIYAATVRFFADLLEQFILLNRLKKEIQTWPSKARTEVQISPGNPLVLRTDLELNLESGGLISHLCGVLEGMQALGTQPRLLATAIPQMNIENIRAVPIPIINRYWDFPELPSLAQNDLVFLAAKSLCEDEAVSFIYQRNVAFTTSGFRIARAKNIPFVLEYNGCESWMNRNWGLPLKHETLADQIEQANLQAADVVAVVSEALKDDLIGRGIPDEKIAVTPCGVDTDRFHPDIDPMPVRNRLGLGNDLVVGFVGTFGRWHGVDILADAFARCFQQSIDHHRKIHLLLIGNGETFPTVEKALQSTAQQGSYHLTGFIKPTEVPAHLAACNILVSPQIANSDGTEFFGSPLKLFEYMAMGKAVIASEIGQIARVIEHRNTGILVKPGDAEALSQAIQSLAADPLERKRLGNGARCAAVDGHSWTNYVSTVLKRLAERCE